MADNEQRQIDIALLNDNIERIGRSPLATTDEGKRVLQVLRTYSAGGKIRYAGAKELDDDRGGWTGDEILINEDYRGNLGKTLPTLVHEAAHAVWRSGHPKAPKRGDSPDQDGQDEYHSVLLELEAYRWLRDKLKLAQPDFELDTRLDRLKNGTLKSIVMQRFK